MRYGILETVPQRDLPSATAARALFRGEPGGLARVLLTTLERAAIIFPALYLMGEKQPKKLVGNSLAAAVAIELVVLWRLRPQEEP